MLTAYPPVLHMHGGGVRMYHNVRLLGEHGHTVHVISFVENEHERELLGSVSRLCASLTAVQRIPDFGPHWLSLDPFLVREFSTPEMDDAIDSALAKHAIDVLQCEYLQMAQYHRRRVRTVLTIHETLSANAFAAFRQESAAALKFKLYYRWMQMLRYEVLATRRFDRVVTMTGYDAGYLQSYSREANICAIPIGIDPLEFQPQPEQAQSPLEVLFVGNFRHTPNVEAAEFLVNEIAPAFPSLRFVLPGDHIPDHLRGRRNVCFTGYAPDTRVFYRRPNTIVAAPLFSGTGQRVKLLEAFTMACPVITTTTGALGFPIRPGCEAIIADDAASFRQALTQLIASQSLRTDLGRQARQMILRHFDWKEIGHRLSAVVSK
jgi:glycosyltransferase involved in cell wall biosynthesis